MKELMHSQVQTTDNFKMEENTSSAIMLYCNVT